jgi:hypothetical protein
MTAMTDIRAALEQQLVTVTGIPSSSNRAWENVRFEPTPGTTWVRMQIIPAAMRPSVRGPSPQLLYEGIFLVDIFAPEGNGANGADVLADAIRDEFTVDDVLTENTTNVRFRWSERGQGLIDSPWYQVPVTVNWYSYRS